MRMEQEVKLDYKDVLIRPKRSTLRSRKQVNLERTYTFRHSQRKWTGIPIMAANMDGVGSFGMHQILAKHKLFTCAVKHYDEKSWSEAIALGANKDFIAISTGTSYKDWEVVQKIIEKHDLHWICIDIANGYSEHFVDAKHVFRSCWPSGGQRCSVLLRWQMGAGR